MSKEKNPLSSLLESFTSSVVAPAMMGFLVFSIGLVAILAMALGSRNDLRRENQQLRIENHQLREDAASRERLYRYLDNYAHRFAPELGACRARLAPSAP